MMDQETNKPNIGGLKASYYLINVGKSMYFSVAIFYLFFIRIGFQINQITMLYGAYGIASITMNLLVPGIGKKNRQKERLYIRILSFNFIHIHDCLEFILHRIYNRVYTMGHCRNDYFNCV